MDDNEVDEDIKLVDEFGAYSRASGDPFQVYLTSVDPTRKKFNYKEKFMKGLQVHFYRMKDEGELDMNDAVVLIENRPPPEKINFFNPLAYILGYLASKNSINGKLNKNIVNEVIEKYKDKSETSTAGIEPADILRYSRYWANKNLFG